MPFLLNIKSDYKICQNCYLFNVHFRSLLHIFASFFCSLILFYPDSSPNSIKSESKVERIGLERVKSCNRSPEPVHGIEERHERTNERTRAQAPTNSRKKRDPPPWNPFISTLEEKEARSSNLRPPLAPPSRPIRRRYGSEAEFFVPHRRGLIRPRGRGYSYFRRFSCNLRLYEPLVSTAVAVPREQKAETRAENCSLSLSLSLCPSPRGFARTVKRGGFLRELRNYVKREGFHLLATGDPAGLSCKAQLRSFDYFI